MGYPLVIFQYYWYIWVDKTNVVKNSHQCPKCGSADIVVESKKSSISYNNYVTVKQNWAKFIMMSRYICLSCGYTEEWVDKVEDLIKIEKKLKKENKDYDGFV